MAGELHGRGMGTACYVWIGLYSQTETTVDMKASGRETRWLFAKPRYYT
jgi:hypothetical protein